jgi:iron complex outermembrane recepter protein
MINKSKRTNKLAWQDNDWGFCPSFAHKWKQTFSVSLYNLKVIYALQGTSAPEGTELAERLFHYSLPLMALLLMFLSSAANAGDVAKPYHIPAQPLSNALLQFAAESKLELIVKSDKLRGFKSSGLDGSMTPAQALSQLLQGSGMTYRFVDANTVTIVPPSSNFIKTANTGQDTEPQTGGEGQVMPKVTVEADAELRNPNYASDPYPNSYTATHATTATKTDTPIRDIPQSIQVIKRKVIDDRQALLITDLANNVSGVQRGGFDFGDFPSQVYLIRGFEGKSLINGFREEPSVNSYDITAVDRVDFLKGPGSVLYGQRGLGGQVNTVTKLPAADRHLWGRASFGSFDLYRTELDVGGALPQNENLWGRMNFAYRNSGSYIDFHKDETAFLSPSFTWKITPDTDLTVLLHYQSQENVFEYGLAPERELLNVPISRFYGEPGFNKMKVESGSASYFLNHRFNDDLRFRSAFRSNIAREQDQGAMATSLLDDRRTLSRQNQTFKERLEADDYALQNELYGKFSTGILKHDAMIGAELARAEFHYGLTFPTGTIPTIDLYNPVYGKPFEDFAAPDITNLQTTDSLGVYFQDQITFLDNLKITGGGRYDWFEYETQPVADPSNKTTVSGNNFSPRVGLVYQPFDSTSLYFGWTNSFNPTLFGRTRGEGLKPETGEQFEVGMKQEFMGDRLWANLAFYKIDRQNVSITDASDPNFIRQIGEQKSQGIELDIQGRPIDGLNLIATYALTDAYVSKDTTIEIGSPLFGVPKHSGSLWATYEIQSGLFKGLGFGSGIYVVDDSRSTGLPLASESESTSVFKLPGYERLDAMLYYKRDGWQAQINFKNLTDERIYETTGYSLKPQAPFSVLGSISYNF